MTTRTSAAVAIRVEDHWRDGTTKVWYVGPFMAHAGSATQHALNELDYDVPQAVAARTLSVETLFLAQGESDLKAVWR